MKKDKATADNKRVSGFGTSSLCPNPRYARTSYTRQPLAVSLKDDSATIRQAEIANLK